MEATTEDLFKIIGELVVENRVLKKVNEELAEALETVMGRLAPMDVKETE